VDIVGFITSLNLFDLVVLLVMAISFVIGFMQGTIRRLLGIGSILFSYLLAANLRDPLGSYFAASWHQFPAEYSYMIAFGAVFATGVVVFSLLIQGFYKQQDLFARGRFVDEVLGGTLGVIQAIIVLGAVIVILDSFFRVPSLPQTSGELILVRSLFNAIDGSGTAHLFREVLIPAFNALVGGLLPLDVRIVT
jgi:membrane protein required for colicin V production